MTIQPILKRKSIPVKVGDVTIGGDHDIVVQSMTNTPTHDVAATVKQIKMLADAGSEIVRITVDTLEAANAVAKIKAQLLADGYTTPLVGCFHYNGHTLLSQVPSCAQSLDKYRINPGNVGFGAKRDTQFAMMIKVAIKYDKPVRIGVNWGSLDQKMLQDLMDKNAASTAPKSTHEVMQDALVESAISSANLAVELGLPRNKIVISCKVSNVNDLQIIYKRLAKLCDFPLHLGLTEAGIGDKSVIATSIALGNLLAAGVGDTIRASLTPQIGMCRTREVEVCQHILQALELRDFKPQIVSCPGCGRTTSTYFQKLAAEINDYIAEKMPVWRTRYPGVEKLNIAVMGCIVNGPGESKHADIGISLPGTGESPSAPVFIDGKKQHTLRGDDISQQFKHILDDYINERLG